MKLFVSVILYKRSSLFFPRISLDIANSTDSLLIAYNLLKETASHTGGSLFC